MVPKPLQKNQVATPPLCPQMPPLFYQHFWNIIDSNVTQAVLLWLNAGIHLETVNHTFLTLIPKTPNPEHTHKYQPISLCNVLYKIFS